MRLYVSLALCVFASIGVDYYYYCLRKNLKPSMWLDFHSAHLFNK